MLAVVLLGGSAINRSKFSSNHAEIAAFEAGDDFTNEASFDGVGLADNKRAVHAANARPTTARNAIRYKIDLQSPRRAIR
jgi:hypothetical protein